MEKVNITKPFLLHCAANEVFSVAFEIIEDLKECEQIAIVNNHTENAEEIKEHIRILRNTVRMAKREEKLYSIDRHLINMGVYRALKFTLNYLRESTKQLTH